MTVRKKHLLTVLLLGILGINIPVLAAVGEWSVNGSNMYYIDGFVGIGKDVVSTPLHVRRSSVIDIAQKIELESTLTGANWEALRIDANANTSNANSISWEFDSINSATGPAVSAYRTSATETDLSFSATDNDLRYELMRLQGASGNVGIGVTDPKSKLSVNGNIQIANANRPMGIYSQNVNNDPMLHLDMNLISNTGLTNNTKGGTFRIDSRNTDPLFQWWSREAGSTTLNSIMSLTEKGVWSLGKASSNGLSSAVANIYGGTLIKGTSDTGNNGELRISTTSGSWIGDNLVIAQKSDHALVETWAGEKPLVLMLGSGAGSSNPYHGNVGIGTTHPKQKLSVNGAILAKEVVVSTASSNWPDYVFADEYKLSPLSEVDKFIKENKHLPNIPSAEEVAENGLTLGEMQKKQMEKIEELTLYLIQLEERINKLENGNVELKSSLNIK